MATRKTQVPGATPEPVEEVQPQQELVETPQEQVEEVRNEAFWEILNTIIENQKRIENKVDSLLNAGGIEQPKKKRWSQSAKGLVYKEID